MAMMFEPPVSTEACISHAQMHQLFQDELYTALNQYEVYQIFIYLPTDALVSCFKNIKNLHLTLH